MSTKALTLAEYTEQVENELMRKFKIGINDCTSESEIEVAFNTGETVTEFIDSIGEKHNLEDATKFPYNF